VRAATVESPWRGPDGGAVHEPVGIPERVGAGWRSTLDACDQLLGGRRRDGEVVVTDDADRRLVELARIAGLPADVVRLPAAMLVACCEEAIQQWESGAVTREVAEPAQVELILASDAA
jgi:hypothetical protein